MCHFKGLLKVKLLLITLASLYCNVTVPEIYVGKSFAGYIKTTILLLIEINPLYMWYLK